MAAVFAVVVGGALATPASAAAALSISSAPTDPTASGAPAFAGAGALPDSPMTVVLAPVGSGVDPPDLPVTSGATAGNRDFGNTPLSRVHVTFEALAQLPGGGDATRATQITCVDTNGANVGSATDDNTLTTGSVKTNQSSLTCTITFIDP